jgi:hypothetical protein
MEESGEQKRQMQLMAAEIEKIKAELFNSNIRYLEAVTRDAEIDRSEPGFSSTTDKPE